ncbi:MAG: hypothetical protein AABZ39_04565 [Spirochaetota bacterium]
MRKLKIYLDTSIISNLFADDRLDWKQTTNELFDAVLPTGEYEFYLSDVVIREINKTNDAALRERMMNAAKNKNITMVHYNEFEVLSLAKQYISEGALPPRSVDDSLHVAIATISGMDILLSWNYRHLSNIERERKLHTVNINEGYTLPLRITNPLEVIHD